jgi:hypothetical protein
VADMTGSLLGRLTASASELAKEERARLWPEFVAFYPDYEFFQRNAGDRQIPIVLLEPR